jgi:hypothetical protein
MTSSLVYSYIKYMKKDHCTFEKTTNNVSSSSQPSHYAFRIKGLLDPHWEWLEGFTVTHLEPGETIISGLVVDQAALHGLLTWIRDLNLTLLSVEQSDPNNKGKEESDG